MEKIIIVGAGQAAAWSAHTLRQNGFKGRVSIISKEEEVFYERPPLSKQYLAGEQDVASLKFFSQEVIEGLNIDWYKPDEVIDIDAFNKEVILKSSHVLAYDSLILATGSRARVPVPEWAKMQNVFTLRTIEDSDRLAKFLVEDKKIAIIGGGWIGLEIASTAKKKNMQVSIFELATRLCQRSTSVEISAFLQQIQEDNGNKVHLDANSIKLKEKLNKQIEVYVNDVLEFDADIVVIGAGAELATELAVKASLTMLNGGVLINSKCQTSDKNIYAAGDIAVHPDLGFCCQSYQNAQNQGIVAAKNILGIEEHYHDIPWLWSDQFDYNIQILGYPIRDDLKLIKRITNDKQFSYLYLNKKNQIVTAFAINDAKVIKLAKRWILANTELPVEDIQNIEFNLMKLKP